jgi:isoleucyl-tRNA synthetase
MREQIRLWFYSQLLMSVALTGRAPFRAVLGYEKMLDERGREMHGSWGNMIEAEDAFARMGADVMRWQYCAQPPSQNLLFGFGPAQEIKRKLLTLWNSVRFLVDYGNVESFRPRLADLDGGPDGDLRPLDRWLVARTGQLVAEATEAYEAYLTVRVIEAFERFVDDLSNWYIRRSRRRFWDGDEDALRTLWFGVVQALRVIGPVMPFLAEHLWRNLVTEACDDAPRSVFLAGWPEPGELDEELLAEVDEVRRIVGLGRKARDAAALKHRQPLRRLVVQGAERARGHVDEIADELRVHSVELGEVEATQLRVKPNLPVLGPRLGKELAVVRRELEAGNLEELGDGRFRVAGHELGPDDVLVERSAREGWALAADDSLVVALDTELDDELLLEGRVLDLIHRLNSMRKDAGLELTDRIAVTLPAAQSELLRHADRIKSEVLADSLEADGDAREPTIERA